MVKRQPKASRDLGLYFVHFSAIFFNRLTRFGSSQFGGGAMFIRRTQKQYLMPARALVAGIEVRRQLAAHKVAQMLDPVDVRNRRSDQMSRHGGLFPGVRFRFSRRLARVPEGSFTVVVLLAGFALQLPDLETGARGVDITRALIRGIARAHADQAKKHQCPMGPCYHDK